MEKFLGHYSSNDTGLAAVRTVPFALRLQFVVDQDRHYPVSIIVILVIPILINIKSTAIQYRQVCRNLLCRCWISLTKYLFQCIWSASSWTSSFGITFHPSINRTRFKYWEKVFLYRTANEFLWYSESLQISSYLDGNDSFGVHLLSFKSDET